MVHFTSWTEVSSKSLFQFAHLGLKIVCGSVYVCECVCVCVCEWVAEIVKQNLWVFVNIWDQRLHPMWIHHGASGLPVIAHKGDGGLLKIGNVRYYTGVSQLPQPMNQIWSVGRLPDASLSQCNQRGISPFCGRFLFKVTRWQSAPGSPLHCPLTSPGQDPECDSFRFETDCFDFGPCPFTEGDVRGVWKKKKKEKVFCSSSWRVVAQQPLYRSHHLLHTEQWLRPESTQGVMLETGKA